MLARLAYRDSVPMGQRIVRAHSAQRKPLALPRPAAADAPRGRSEPETGGAQWADGTRTYDSDARRVRQALAAYAAVELVQPRPGLIIHVRA